MTRPLRAIMHVSRTPHRFLARQRHPVVLFTYGVALLAWILLATRRLPMSGSAMAMDMAAPGMPEAMALSNGAVGVGLYLLVWGIMMTAMMYPSSAHAFRAYYDTEEPYEAEGPATRARKTVAVVSMMGTYTLVWLLTGLVPLAFNIAVPVADRRAGGPRLPAGGDAVGAVGLSALVGQASASETLSDAERRLRGERFGGWECGPLGMASEPR